MRLLYKVLIGIGIAVPFLIYLGPFLIVAYLYLVPESGNGDGKFDSITGIAIDRSGNVYVADPAHVPGGGYSRIQKFDSNGTFLTVWNSDAIRTAIDRNSDEDNIYSVNGNIGITKYGNTGVKLTTLAGPSEASIANAKGYRDIALDSKGNIFVADGSSRIIEFSPEGHITKYWDLVQSEDWNGTQVVLTSIAVDPLRDSIYVVLSQSVYREQYKGYEHINGEIQKYRITSSGKSNCDDRKGEKEVAENVCFATKWKADVFTGIAIDSHGNIYVGAGFAVKKFAPDGSFVKDIGRYFNGVGDIEVGNGDQIYIGNTNPIQAITVWTADGQMVKYWGSCWHCRTP